MLRLFLIFMFVNGLTSTLETFGLVDVGHLNGHLKDRRGSFESHLKDMVYKEKPQTIPDIRRVIADKIAIIDTELCQKVCHSVAARLVSCIEHNREQFEQSE